MTKRVVSFVFVLMFLLMITIFFSSDARAWSNGGYSDDPTNPDYGTHDWIAEHALDWLPEEEKQYVADNLAAYLYGTELPDNGIAPDGIGDTTKHHIYYWSNGSLQDDVSAVRACEEYNKTLDFLNVGDFENASKTVGIMSHYIVDMAVFGHVMGAYTDWGSEEHHSDYESYVNQRTSSYDAEFNIFLTFDGELDVISAYNATIDLAYDTTFDLDGDLTCVWMDQNYDWSNPVFKNRCGESLNLAVNYLADVLHTLYLETMSVHNIDTGLDYATIQEAINAPETLDGHTIYVDVGTHYEHVVVNKSLSLVGENRNDTVIDGSGSGTVVSIDAPLVNLFNFTIRNGGETLIGPVCDSGILVRAYGVSIGNITSTSNAVGITLDETNHCNVSDNSLHHNKVAMALHWSEGCILRNNKMKNNLNGSLLFDGYTLSHFIHDIDTSNTINGNPIHYLISQRDVVIDSSSFPSIGFLGIVNSTNIYVKNLTQVPILFGFSNNCTIQQTSVSNESVGFTIFGDFNRILNNNISKNVEGIAILGTGNLIENNNISYNYIGIWAECTDTRIFHNNLISNELQMYCRYPTYLDNGVEGNYWSDYNGTDLNRDGIGDTPYVVNESEDNCPLMGMFSDFKATMQYHVTTICNSTISAFQFDEINNLISFNVTAEDGTKGFCRACIPHALMSPPCTVTINKQPPLYINDTSYDNGTHRWIYFTYEHSTKEVLIIPEFPSFLILPLSTISTLLAVIVYRGKHSIPKGC